MTLFNAYFTEWWLRFQEIYNKQRIPHALLLIGPQYTGILEFSYKIAKTILCSQQEACEKCISCHLLSKVNKYHPDFHYIKPKTDTIKINQIRNILDVIHTSPQLGNKRIIMINPLEKLNSYAANALLKVLEEPPSSVIFILLAEQISYVIPTILSRCQRWQLNIPETISYYLTIGSWYDKSSPKGKIFIHHCVILEDLLNLMHSNISICELAIKWSGYDLESLIWLLYLITADLLRLKFISNTLSEEIIYAKQINSLSHYFTSTLLCSQLDNLHAIIRKLKQNIPINASLNLENILLGYKITHL